MPPHRAAAAPSRSHTSSGNVANITGQTLTGANAKVDAAPAENAISALRQPEARMTGLARLNQFTVSISRQLAADRPRRRPERMPIHAYPLAAEPAARRCGVRRLAGARGCVQWPALPACA